MRIVDAEDAHAMFTPEQQYVAQRRPEFDAIGAIQVWIDDVLIFFWRVFGVADGAVGAPLEPLGMLADPRMVRRALHGEIQRDLHVVCATGFDQAVKVVERSKLRMQGIVAAFLAADGVRTSRIVRACRQRIVLAFAIGHSDGMDRRQIEHIEAQRSDVRDPGDAVVPACRARPGCCLGCAETVRTRRSPAPAAGR